MGGDEGEWAVALLWGSSKVLLIEGFRQLLLSLMGLRLHTCSCKGIEDDETRDRVLASY